MEKEKYRVLVGKPKQTDHLENPGIGERILKWIIMKPVGIACTGFIWLRVRENGGLLCSQQ
jgi:hypothetical protein